MQRQPFVGWQRVGHQVQLLDDALHVAQPFQGLAHVGVCRNRLGTPTVEVGLRIGRADALCPEQQLRRELLVLVVDAGREPQLAQYGPAEQVAASRGLQVVVRQVLRAAAQVVGIERGCCLLVRLVGEVEHHHVGTFISHQVETMLVGWLYEVVVAVDKLHVLPGSRLQSSVACLAQAQVALAYVDYVVEILA